MTGNTLIIPIIIVIAILVLAVLYLNKKKKEPVLPQQVEKKEIEVPAP